MASNNWTGRGQEARKRLEIARLVALQTILAAVLICTVDRPAGAASNDISADTSGSAQGSSKPANADWSISSYLAKGPLAGHLVQIGPDTLFTWNGFVNGGPSLNTEEQQPQLLFSLGPATLLTLPDERARRAAPEHTSRHTADPGQKSFGINRLGLGVSQHLGGVQLSLAANYGEAKLPVHPNFKIIDSDDLLRLGAELGVGGLRLGSSIGYEVKPFKIGDTLSWDLTASYGQGSWTFAVSYAETTFTESPTSVEAEVLNTVQAGAQYGLAPGVSASVSAVYWGFTDHEDRGYSDLAGVVGLSLRF